MSHNPYAAARALGDDALAVLRHPDEMAANARSFALIVFCADHGIVADV